LVQPFSLILIDPIDWIAIGLFVFIWAGSFPPSSCTACKVGGWKNVNRSAWIAIGALTLFIIERIIQNQEFVI
jgi:hypothetical protein